MPVNKWSIGSVARGLAQYPREQQAIEQKANERREEFAYDIMKMKYKFDQEAKQAQLTLQQPKMLTPDEIFKMKSKIEKLKLKYRDKEMTGTRYGRGRWMQEVEADGANLGKLQSQGELGNQEAQALYDNILTHAETLPDSLVDWMTIAEQRNIKDTSLGAAKATALASGFGNQQLPQQTGSQFIGGGCTPRQEMRTYKGGLEEPMQGSDRQAVEGYREYKGYPAIGSKGTATVPDLSGMAQKGSLMDETQQTPQAPQPAGDIRNKVRQLLENNNRNATEEDIDEFIELNPEFK